MLNAKASVEDAAMRFLDAETAALLLLTSACFFLIFSSSSLSIR